jgi:transketolase
MTAQPAPAPSADVSHNDLANAIRALSMDAVQKANSGHPGMPMGMADVATVLFTKFLKFDASAPTWFDRDRFILSAGHGSMLLYSILHLTGYEKMTLDQLKSFRQMGSLCAGHPEVMPDAGIEMTTGPLGQGIATAVGFALGERLMQARYGSEISNHYTYVIASDGDLMEGMSHEAASLAGHLKLSRLIVLYDDNGISIDGPTSLSFSDDSKKRFEAYGWDARDVNGHDPAAIAAAIAAAQLSDKPSIICCKTRIGFGAPTKENSSSSHGSPLGDEEIAGARKNLCWDHEPFHVPDAVLAAWRAAGTQGTTARKQWQSRLDALPAEKRAAFDRALAGDITRTLTDAIRAFKAKAKQEAPKIATRAASGKVLEALVPVLPELIGGSADLTGSNLTLVKSMGKVAANDFSGSYIYYGVREHAMAAAMNGLALHGGIIPYGGTFLTFTDYCRPAIRLSALMKNRVVYVMTHDSIGLGEDGPTHQPVEHMPALRCIPNLLTFRPCDVVETAECWEAALLNASSPSVLALTRQNLPLLRREEGEENLSLKGAYVLWEDKDAKATIWATGSEVEIAVNALELLAKDGIKARIVSAPCLELFNRQDAAYRASVFGTTKVNAAVEAAVRHGWDAYIGKDGIFVGMPGFGESAPYQELYAHYGITPENVAKLVKAAV